MYDAGAVPDTDYGVIETGFSCIVIGVSMIYRAEQRGYRKTYTNVVLDMVEVSRTCVREYVAPVLSVSVSFAEEGFAVSPDYGIEDLNGTTWGDVEEY